jgi:hypothetical protein
MTARCLPIPFSGCIFSSLNITYTLIWSLVFLIFLQNPFPHSAWTRGENVKLSQFESLQLHHPLGLWQLISMTTREVDNYINLFIKYYSYLIRIIIAIE